ncbi:alpha/beta hydrolase [Mycobacterium hodleri]|uniref:Alpha/beta hydrolase n=2 Tax=Mycolicibacterium hodleri TaxID=49897 RepID=A0A544W5P8_9MYCO|nr:alpha/beta hydrolase [Mycolicibacterium hodleri]TQR87550.1 alpha/beta hydrolase [Mycolicibacterium hodleri]
MAAAPPADSGPGPAVGDVATRRSNTAAMFTALASSMEVSTDVEVRRYELTTADGAVLPLTWYEPATGDRTASAAMLYLHGGGMIMSLEQTAPVYDVIVPQYVSRSRVPALVVDYRVAPEHPHPTPVEDCYAALQWLEAHAAELNVDPTRLAVGGDSAGGGLAAGVALLARDRSGPQLALQLLIYPMLDDRTVVPDPQLPPEFLVWNYDDNVTGWGALLGDASGGADVSPYAAPARAADLSGLPPAYVDVGDLDIFRDEDVDYARRLLAAGVPTELHVFPGCPHGFEIVAGDLPVSRQALDSRVRRLAAL